MERGWGQEGNECPVRETIGRMVIPTGVAGRRVCIELYCKAGECMGRGRGQKGNECPVREIFYLTVAPPFPGSHLNMFLVKKENPPFFIPDPALPGRTYRPRASPVRVLLRRRVSGRYVLPQLASCGEMAIA
jgi:hypothetical protein